MSDRSDKFFLLESSRPVFLPRCKVKFEPCLQFHAIDVPAIEDLEGYEKGDISL